MATLEIRARHVDGTFENAQHLYWLYTNDAGEQYSFSGFPGDNGHFSMLYENILVVDSLYDAENDDFAFTTVITMVESLFCLPGRS